MALLHSIWLYITQPWLYYTLLHSTLLTMPLLYSTRLYFLRPWLYFLHYSYYFTLFDSTLLFHGSTTLYWILHKFTIALTLLKATAFYIIALVHCAWHNITLPWFYFTLLDYTLLCHGSTSLYLTLQYSTIDLLHCLITWLYLTRLDSTALCHGFTSL